MSSEGRMVYVTAENVLGEIVSEQLHGATVRYYLGGFEYEEFMTADDYEILDYFDYEETDD